MPRMRISGFLLGLVLGMAVAVPVARAQDFEAASKHFAAAQKAYSEKAYHEAAHEFEEAYGLTKDPVLLYNIGESYQHAGDGHKAVDAYRSYLKGSPPDADSIKARIAKIEKASYKIADESVAPVAAAPPPATDTQLPQALPESQIVQPFASPAAETPSSAPVTAANLGLPPTPVASPAATTKQVNDAETPQRPREPEITFLDDGPRTKLRTAAWIGVAATVAVFTTGAILGLAAQARSDEISRRLNFVDSTGQPGVYDSAAQSDLNGLRHDGQLYNNVAIGFFAASGALAVATVVLFVVDHKRATSMRDKLQGAFSPGGPGGPRLGLGGTF